MGSEVVMFYKFKQKNIAHCDKQWEESQVLYVFKKVLWGQKDEAGLIFSDSSEERKLGVLFTLLPCNFWPFSTQSLVVMMVKILCWNLSHRLASPLRSQKLKFASQMETSLFRQSCNLHVQLWYLPEFRLRVWNWKHGADTKNFWDCPMMTSAEYIPKV